METQQIDSSVVESSQVLTYTVDSFENGIAFGQHKQESGSDPRDYYSLRIVDEAELVRLRSRYVLHPKNPLHELERHLMRLSNQGVLRKSIIYFGVTTDPFHPFQGKFDASMKFLDLFRKYMPGQLVIQTRSPLVVIAMPVLQKLGAHAAVTIGVETNNQESADRYTPGLPRVEERLKAAKALDKFGINVTVQVSPVLPYGDWKNGAQDFADKLAQSAKHIHVQPITDGSARAEKRMRQSMLAKKLAEDRQFYYLRPDSAKPLIEALSKIDTNLLKSSEISQLKGKQLKMFAA